MAPDEIKLLVTASPSFIVDSKVKPAKLKVETQANRSYPGGLAEIKAAANYPIGTKCIKYALECGYKDIVWISGGNISEASTSNLFFYIINNKEKHELVTPLLDGSILPGITRNSIMELMKGDSRFETLERKITLIDFLKLSQESRVLCNLNTYYRSLRYL